MPTNIEKFFKETIGPIVITRKGRPIEAPELAIDESTNHPLVKKLLCLLVSESVVSGSTPMWVEMRQGNNGEKISVMGGVPPYQSRIIDYGKPIKYWSWPDRRVADFIAAKFTSQDRIVLLTENTKGDKDGLWNILHQEFEPSIKTYGAGRLGLLLLAKRGKADYPDYCKAVEFHLRDKGVGPGFQALIIPSVSPNKSKTKKA